MPDLNLIRRKYGGNEAGSEPVEREFGDWFQLVNTQHLVMARTRQAHRRFTAVGLSPSG